MDIKMGPGMINTNILGERGKGNEVGKEGVEGGIQIGLKHFKF